MCFFSNKCETKRYPNQADHRQLGELASMPSLNESFNVSVMVYLHILLVNVSSLMMKLGLCP